MDWIFSNLLSDPEIFESWWRNSAFKLRIQWIAKLNVLDVMTLIIETKGWLSIKSVL